MTFTSHNSKDEAVARQVVVCLKDIFGQNNISYDSWSIQPGDGIINETNEGLTRCKLFPFFVPKNSLSSNMVESKWQNAVMEMTSGQTRIIPVRLDNYVMSTILPQSLYVDLFQNGLEVVLKQIVDTADGRNTFSPQFSEFSNLIAYRWREGTTPIIECMAQYYMEPIPNSAFIITNTEEQISYKCKDRVTFNHGSNPNAVHTGEGPTFSAIRLDFP